MRGRSRCPAFHDFRLSNMFRKPRGGRAPPWALLQRGHGDPALSQVQASGPVHRLILVVLADPAPVITLDAVKRHDGSVGTLNNCQPR